MFRAWFMEMGKFVPVLLLGDRSNFLWDAAWDFMDTVCLRSCYRTDHLPTDAEQVRRSIDNYVAARQNAPSAPSGAEVMNLDALKMQEGLVPKDHVEDYRLPELRIPMGPRLHSGFPHARPASPSGCRKPPPCRAATAGRGPSWCSRSSSGSP